MADIITDPITNTTQDSNPNLEVLTLPGGGTVSVPTTIEGLPTTPAGQVQVPTVPSSADQLTPYLNQWQDALYQSVGYQSSPIDSSSSEFGLGVIPLISAANATAPVAPNLEQTYSELRQSMGVSTLETEINDLKALQREQEAIKRERIAATRGEVSRQDAIEGRVGQIERQENERIDALNRDIAYKVDFINSAMNTIDKLMTFKQMDFQNAKDLWETNVQTSLALYKQFRSDYEFDKTFEEQQKQNAIDNATANLNMYVKLITEGNLTYAGLDATTKAEINQLELTSGLGIGFVSKLKMTPGANIKDIIQRVDPNTGIKYADVLYVQPDGSIKIKTQKLGKAELSLAEQKALKVYGTGGSSTSEKSAAQYKAMTGEMNTLLGKKTGSDGKVAPDTYKYYKSQWMSAGLSSEDFDQQFGNYVNTTYAFRSENVYGLSTKYWKAGQ